MEYAGESGGTGMMGVNICEGFCFTFQVPVQYYGETSIGIPGCATAFSCLVHADGGSGSSDTTSDATFGYAGADGDGPAGDAATPAGDEPPPGEGNPPVVSGGGLKVGDSYERTFETTKGPVGVLGQVLSISEDGVVTLHLLAYPNEAASLKIGIREVLAARQQIAADFKEMGFNGLIIDAFRGKTSSSANPGHEFVLPPIDLTGDG